MAIQINGNGTITGIAVGGLPNGIVDTDMLAANAVSSAKLASGVGGKMLQVVTGTTTSQLYKSNNSTYGDTGLTATITPSSGTKILVIINQPVYTGSYNYTGNSIMYIKALRDSTELTQTQFGQDTEANGRWEELWGTFNFTYLDTHGADGSTAVTYKTQYKGSSSTEAYVQRMSEFGQSVNRANIQLIEVAS
jgi:hypothetical protein